jgi:glucose-6-phosphate isomerase
VIVSKTLQHKTLTNSETIRKWFLSQEFGTSQADVAKHFVAVSTNIEKVTKFGINQTMFSDVGLGRRTFFFMECGRINN